MRRINLELSELRKVFYTFVFEICSDINLPIIAVSTLDEYLEGNFSEYFAKFLVDGAEYFIYVEPFQGEYLFCIDKVTQPCSLCEQIESDVNPKVLLDRFKAKIGLDQIKS